MAGGVDDDATLSANRDGFRRVELRRRLRDATKVDMRTDLFGASYNSPISQSARNYADAASIGLVFDSETKRTTPAGATFTAPAAWSLRSEANTTVLTPPDLRERLSKFGLTLHPDKTR
jgi:hypothetical protein